ncbi:hypothetical protein B4U80_00552 [Leptotrombidium deliense]|uniref:Maelstrom domain-containing protein n=1 Tax=Leptotrombidium deliense TaxID=299467 RepID=A0A443S0P7_9ACAR|nr:hypothetical protein B4U80_00552 [Leptotrombidium deliense]
MLVKVVLKTREDNKFYPNEIGIVEYYSSKGIVNSFHEFIDTRDIPLGFARMAIKQEQIHKIPSNIEQAKGIAQEISKLMNTIWPIWFCISCKC